MDDVRTDFVKTTQQLLTGSSSPQALAQTFNHSLRDTWPMAEIGFAVNLDGEIYSPHAQRQRRGEDLSRRERSLPQQPRERRGLFLELRERERERSDHPERGLAIRITAARFHDQHPGRKDEKHGLADRRSEESIGAIAGLLSVPGEGRRAGSEHEKTQFIRPRLRGYRHTKRAPGQRSAGTTPTRFRQAAPPPPPRETRRRRSIKCKRRPPTPSRCRRARPHSKYPHPRPLPPRPMNQRLPRVG